MSLGTDKDGINYFKRPGSNLDCKVREDDDNSMLLFIKLLFLLGKPTPSLTWWRESVLLDDSYEVSGEGVVRNEIEITSLQRHDLMAVFTCQASNNNVTVPLSKYVTVDMNCKYNKTV